MNDRAKYLMTLARQRADREMTAQTPVPHRITTALNLCGLYGPEVDRALGGEEPMVDLWESGELVPTREQVEALAELTQYPVKFFYKPVTERGGWGWLCGSDGCERVWAGPPATPEPPEPIADVIPISPCSGADTETDKETPTHG